LDICTVASHYKKIPPSCSDYFKIQLAESNYHYPSPLCKTSVLKKILELHNKEGDLHGQHSIAGA